MALDYGEARIGVAISDPTGILAQPLESIEQRGRGQNPGLERVAALAREYEVGCIVIGLPLSMTGRAGPQVQRVREFGAAVAERTGVRVEYIDERWTSREAERVLRAAPSKTRRGKGKVDPIAAALILGVWLAREQG